MNKKTAQHCTYDINDFATESLILTHMIGNNTSSTITKLNGMNYRSQAICAIMPNSMVVALGLTRLFIVASDVKGVKAGKILVHVHQITSGRHGRHFLPIMRHAAHVFEPVLYW